jgi:predicted HTH domain antitoxin
MEIIIEIPEDIGNQLQKNWQDLPQKILEALAIEAYRNGIMTPGQIQQLLKMSSLGETETFLRQSQIAFNQGEEVGGKEESIKTLSAAVEELQEICVTEDYSLEIPSRYDRPNLFF